MRRVVISPFWQVLLGTCLFFASEAVLAAQPKRPRPPPSFVQFGEPDQAEGARVLADFRSRRLPDSYFEIELSARPRRGDEQRVTGRMWIGQDARGQKVRVDLPASGDQGERRWLVENGPGGAVWSWQAGGAIAGSPLSEAELFQPLAVGDLTAFDLQMPYLQWTDAVYEGVAKLRGRVAEVFLLYPPASLANVRPELLGVRVYLDSQFHALLQSEWIGEGNRVLRTLAVSDFKKVGDHWVIKTIDWRDEATRNKTRLQVRGAATGLNWPANSLDAGGLAGSPPLVPAQAVQALP